MLSYLTSGFSEDKIIIFKLLKILFSFYLLFSIYCTPVFGNIQCFKSKFSQLQDSLLKNTLLVYRTDIFTVTESMPRFSGGTIALNKYLVENMKYPIYIDSNNKKEKIFLKFVVESDGSLNYVTILKGLTQLAFSPPKSSQKGINFCLFSLFFTFF